MTFSTIIHQFDIINCNYFHEAFNLKFKSEIEFLNKHMVLYILVELNLIRSLSSYISLNI